MSCGIDAPTRFEFIGIERPGRRARVLVVTDLGVLRVSPVAFVGTPHFASLPTDDQDTIRHHAGRVSSLLR